VTTRYLDHLGSHDLPNRVRSIGPVFAPPKPPREELGELLGRLSDAEVTQLVTLFRRAAG
jgi:hypothetical protein